MPIEDVIKFATQNPVAYMATVDTSDGVQQPRVRAFDMWKVDESGFYFHNNATEGVYTQMTNNPKVELFFHSPDRRSALRVLGQAELLNDASKYYAIETKREFETKTHSKLAEGKPMIRVTGKAWLRPSQGKRGKYTHVPVEEFEFK